MILKGPDGRNLTVAEASALPAGDFEIYDLVLKDIESVDDSNVPWIITANRGYHRREQNVDDSYVPWIITHEILADFEGTSITDAGLRQIAKRPDLGNGIGMRRTTVTGEGFDAFKGRLIAGLNIMECPITREGWERISELGGLHSLYCGKTKADDEVLRLLASRLPTLRLVGLWANPVTDAGVGHLAGLGQLAELDLRATLVTDAVVPHLLRISKLRKLDLTETHISPEAVATLRQSLPNCKITWSPTPVELPPLARTPRELAELVIKMGGRVALRQSETLGPDVSSIVDLPEGDWVLGKLVVARLEAVDDELVSRVHRDLWPANVDFDGTSITDASLRLLAQMPPSPQYQLRFLSTAVEGEGFEAFKDKNIRVLVISRSPISSAGWRAICQVREINDLYADDTRIDDQIVTELTSRHPRLFVLNLSQNPITDAGVEAISKLKLVTYLGLGGCSALTDKSIDNLMKMTSLKQIDIWGNQTTADGIARLQAALPDTKIVWHLPR